jgi:hypothetical protein
MQDKSSFQVARKTATEIHCIQQCGFGYSRCADAASSIKVILDADRITGGKRRIQDQQGFDRHSDRMKANLFP